MERQGRLDQPGHPGGGHRVADQGRDRAEDARPPSGRREGRPQGPQLGAVGRRDAQAVPLDQADGRRVDARPAIGPADRPDVAPRVGRGQARARPSLAMPDPLDDGVDPVAVALGVGQSLQDDHAHPFARHHPVGVLGEGPRLARLARGRRAGEKTIGKSTSASR